MKKFIVSFEKYSLCDRFQHSLQLVEATDDIDMKNRVIRPWIEQNPASEELSVGLDTLETTLNNKVPSFMYDRNTRIRMNRECDTERTLYTATYNEIGDGLYIHKPHRFYLTKAIIDRMTNHSLISDGIKIINPQTVEFVADLDTVSNTYITLGVDNEVVAEDVKLYFAKHDRLFKYADLLNDRKLYEQLAVTQILSFGLYHSILESAANLYSIDHTGVKHLTDINGDRMIILKSVSHGTRMVVSVSDFFNSFKLG